MHTTAMSLNKKLCISESEKCLTNSAHSVKQQHPYHDAKQVMTRESTFSSVAHVKNVEELSNSLGKIDVTNESSQERMEMLAVADADTQICSQLCTESPNACYIRLILHPDMQASITAKEKLLLEKKGLFQIEMNRSNSCISLGRDDFLDIFRVSDSIIQPIRLSRKHCLIEGYPHRDHNDLGVYVTDKSTNGVRIDGLPLQKDRKYRVYDGQTIALLSSCTGRVILGYLVQDPRRNSFHRQGLSRLLRACSSPQPKNVVQNHTLGVLFSTPLVGKDTNGKYHPIAELDVKREYNILKNSLFEAANCVLQVPQSDDSKQLDEYQMSPQIHVNAKFASTESFRVMVTIGCRALHLSGHGDENHLYFEDGLGLVHPIPHTSLKELFSAGGKAPLRLVFVSACSSAPLANAFVSCGIPHVIAVRTTQRIEDHAAIEFTRSFYLALATGKSVGSSFEIAQQSVSNSPNIKGPAEVARKFLLLPEDGDHSEIIFPLLKVPSSDLTKMGPLELQKYPKLWFEDLPAICQGFCNRAIDVYKICLALLLKQQRITRLVTISGEEGIGKTAVAYAVANYVGPRMTIEGGVKVISVAQIAQEEHDRTESLYVEKDVSVRQGIVFKAAKALIERHLKQSSVYFMSGGRSNLLVLDGCDFLTIAGAYRQRFRCYLSHLLTNNPSLKILLTARTSITDDEALTGVGERVFPLTRFSPKMSAQMLLGLMNRSIRLNEIKRCQSTTSNKIEMLASHPALIATNGIPKKIANLAAKLNSVSMDEIEVIDHGDTSQKAMKFEV
uniref:Uncharacterized protein AlNc14C5G771 n=1 Tax=Albugo laibachii Nc14 TaxID=890382 RepID=F0W0Z1_9STRA|nr:conserved hypothetical protein [Albugo laibachii Nc14]|eukprot:CCA14715.1 conserved hypothetical protein [Albugo laibachii Nc14]